jgi:hypothetical protein
MTSQVLQIVRLKYHGPKQQPHRSQYLKHEIPIDQSNIFNKLEEKFRCVKYQAAQKCFIICNKINWFYILYVQKSL